MNNYTDDDIRMFEAWTNECPRMVISKEVGESGTPHLQGRITFARAYRLAALKKLHATAHWEPTKASSDSLYCMKQGSEIIIQVSNGHQGKRTDLHNVVDAIKAGMTTSELWREHTTAMIKYSKGILTAHRHLTDIAPIDKYPLHSFSEPPVDFDELHTGRGRSLLVVGPPKIGKTEYAKLHFERPLFVTHKDNLGEFDPQRHDGIIFDDMDFSHWPRSAQIHLLDVDNPRTIDIKFGTATIPARTRKIFTSNTHGCFDLNDPAIKTRVLVKEVSDGLINNEVV